MLGLGAPIYCLLLLRAIVDAFPGKVKLLAARLDASLVGGLLLIFDGSTGPHPFQTSKTRHLDTASAQPRVGVEAPAIRGIVKPSRRAILKHPKGVSMGIYQRDVVLNARVGCFSELIRAISAK